MLSQSMCTCPHHLGLTCIASSRTPNQQADPLETKLSKYSINYLNSFTKTAERGPVMEAININTGGTYFAVGSEKAQAIPLYCLPDKKAIHGLPKHVDLKIKEIDASKMSDPEKEEEKKKLETWRSKAVAQFSEDIVSNKILKIAKEKDEECLVLTGYKSETYLCTIREKAKVMRSLPTDPLNEAEKDVTELLGLDLDVTQELAKIMVELPNKVLSPCDMKNNDGLKKAIKNIVYGKKMKNSIETIFKDTLTPLNESTLKNICEYSSYLHQVEKVSLEVDHLTIFPHQKKILQVETKSVMKTPLRKLKEGAFQCNKFCQLVSKCHGDILLPGYTFIKVVALPMIENQSKLVAEPGSNTQPPCANCKSYIWTQEELEKVDEWMESNILTSAAVPQTPPDYKDLFNRLVGFMSLSSLRGQFFHTEEEANTTFDEAIAGEDAGITAEGLSQEQQSTELNGKLATIKLWDIKGKPLSHLETFILWNSDQLTLILQNPDRVCLSSDFGTGKSLLLKYMAKKKAEELMKSSSADKSVFISLGAAEDYRYGADWKKDTIYDIATRMEFSHSGVLFYSTKDLVNKFTKTEEQEWNFKLQMINKKLYLANDACIVECARDLVNMVTTQIEITDVGIEKKYEKSIEDQVNALIARLEIIEIRDDANNKNISEESKKTLRLINTLLETITLTLEMIMTRLILAHPSFSYFFDEVSVGITNDFKFPHLTSVWTVITGSIWMALRPTYIHSNVLKRYSRKFSAFKTELEQNNVHFHTLAKFMRNTFNIVQLANTIQETTEDGCSLTPSSSSSLPLNTISGPIPTLIIVDDLYEIYTRGVKYAIDMYSSNEPLVILDLHKTRDAGLGRMEQFAMLGLEPGNSPYVVYLPGQPFTDEEEKVKMFLKRPHGKLITSIPLFNGCQAKHIITCVRAGSYYRGGIMRGRITSVIVTNKNHPQVEKLKKTCKIVKV